MTGIEKMLWKCVTNAQKAQVFISRYINTYSSVPMSHDYSPLGEEGNDFFSKHFPVI